MTDTQGVDNRTEALRAYLASKGFNANRIGNWNTSSGIGLAEDAFLAGWAAATATEISRYEYRAWIRRPWSIVDPAEHRERGWTEEPVILSRKEDVKDVYAIKRSEESHAYVHRWERRSLIEGEWEAMR